MLYPVYKSVKKRLTAQVPAIKAIQWYNNQYVGVIAAEPMVLIEFPSPADIEPLTKSTDRTELAIRIHYLTRAVSDADNMIPDSQVEAHEADVANVLATLKHYQLLDSEGVLIGKPLQYIQYRSVHDYEGWLVTWLTFTTKLTL